MEIKGIFFDLYGTLLLYDDLSRSWEEWKSAFINALNSLGVCLNHEHIDAIASEIFSKPMLYRENNLTPYECRIKEVISGFGVDLNDAGLGDIARRTVEAWNEHISLDPEAVSVLKTIGRTKKTALVSNFDYPPYIYRILARYELDKLFDHVTVEATGLEAAETAYVGGSDVDVEGARLAGMMPVRIVRNQPAIKDSEVLQIDRLNRILEFLA
jgi:FMN phosphatase YigB (HAD superfamily)